MKCHAEECNREAVRYNLHSERAFCPKHLSIELEEKGYIKLGDSEENQAEGYLR